MHASVHDAKTNLSRLIEAAQRGERVVITRYGIPAVELVPARPATLTLGGLQDRVAPPPDSFFDPLSDAELQEWEG